MYFKELLCCPSFWRKTMAKSEIETQALTSSELSSLTPCARQHMKQIKSLNTKQLAEEHELSCGCTTAPLRDLLNFYACPKCDEVYYYSFCWNAVVENSHSWHCEKCRKCREWREWHCEKCNKCTYGVSLPCERCGSMSELAKLIGSE